MNISDIAIIVVWFNPSELQISRYVAINNYCHVIAIDNSSDCYADTVKLGSLDYIPLWGNKGIAYAQNIGIKKAEELGYEFICFFDQDSIPNIEHISKLRNVFIELCKSDSKVGAIGPCLINEATGTEYANYRDNNGSKCQEVEMIMSTSTLTSINNVHIIGGMDEKLFIDFVDHEWCWRAKSKGYKIYQTEQVKTIHTVGQSTVKFLGYERPISNPSRYYYQFRNSIWLCGCHYAPPKWRMRVFPRLLLELMFIIIYNRAATKYAIKGIKDGLIKRK